MYQKRVSFEHQLDTQRHQLRDGRQTPVLSPTQIFTFPPSTLPKYCLISMEAGLWPFPVQSGFM